MKKFTKNRVNKVLDNFVARTNQLIHNSRYRKSVSSNDKYKAFCSAFKYFEGRNVIDVGCFVGFYSCLMSPFAKSVLGVDINGKGIQQAIILKDIFDVSNVNFFKMSAFKITKPFLRENKITGLFIHKTMSTKSGWTQERQAFFWDLTKKYIDIIVASATTIPSNKVDILRPVFADDKRFRIIEIGQHLVVIERIK